MTLMSDQTLWSSASSQLGPFEPKPTFVSSRWQRVLGSSAKARARLNVFVAAYNALHPSRWLVRHKYLGFVSGHKLRQCT